MRISKIIIEDKIKEKILWKHNIGAVEINQILLDNPYILKISNDIYMAIGYANRYITIIFKLNRDTVFIVTAYPSSDAQRKLYKHKRE